METYDAIIIGFGKGGKTLAGELAAHGQRVAMVERSDKMYGGACINIACIPTKTLVHQAKVLSYAPNRDFAQKARDYREAVARKNEVTGFLRGKNYAMLADNPQVTVITGSASFRSPWRRRRRRFSCGAKKYSSTPVRRRSFRISKGCGTARASAPAPPCWSWKRCPGVWSSAAGTSAWSTRPVTPCSARRSHCWNVMPACWAARTPTLRTACDPLWRNGACVF